LLPWGTTRPDVAAGQYSSPGGTSRTRGTKNGDDKKKVGWPNLEANPNPIRKVGESEVEGTGRPGRMVYSHNEGGWGKVRKEKRKMDET